MLDQLAFSCLIWELLKFLLPADLPCIRHVNALSVFYFRILVGAHFATFPKELIRFSR